jgi:hypothetical protein
MLKRCVRTSALVLLATLWSTIAFAEPRDASFRLDAQGLTGKAPESAQRLLPLLYVEDNDENWNIVKLRLSARMR